MFTLENFILNERTPIDQKGATTGVGQVRNYDVEVGQIGDTAHFDPGLSRPYRDDNGRVWVDVTVGNDFARDKDGEIIRNSSGQPRYTPIFEPQLVQERRRKDLPVIPIVSNATVLRKDQWIMIDRMVTEAARKRMNAWTDLRAANTFGGFDGLATPILEYERLNDAGEAIVDMDAASEGNNFAPTFALQGQPLPITHADFQLSERFLATSRARGGVGADTIRAAMAGRRVAEAIEQTTIGTQTGLTYGISTDYGQTSAVYGYVNHPERITVTGATAPTGSNGTTILTEWLDHRDELYQKNFYGPFNIYHATNYDQFIDNDFKTESDKTVRERLMAVGNINSIKRLDYLTTAGTVVWVSMDENVEAVVGMELVTVQWVEKGGLRLHFKVMAIMAPRIKSKAINTGTTGPATISGTSAPVLHVTV